MTAAMPAASLGGAYAAAEIYLDLSATKDTARRQQKALRALQGQVGQGVNVGPCLPLVLEVAASAEPPLRREALRLLAGALCSSSLRERLSGLRELLAGLWALFPSADEQGAGILLRGFGSLAPEDLKKLFASVEPELLIRRALDHPVAPVRALALQTFGEALVRAWPCVAVGRDEPLRDSCTEAFRMIFGRLSAEDSPADHRAAAAAVLDGLLAAYLGVELQAFAPIALLHVAWRFAPTYAALLVELTHDLEPALPRLCSLQDLNSLVTRSCIWIPELDAPSARATGPPVRAGIDSEWPVLAAEAAAFRAALLWMIFHAGGLSRRDLEDGGGEGGAGRCGSLMYDLVREVAGAQGPRRAATGAAPRAARRPVELPPELSSIVRRAAEAAGTLPAASFARCRASLMQAILELARGAGQLPSRVAGDVLLEAAEAMSRAAQGSSPLLLQFVVECLCSLLALWPLVRVSISGELLNTFVRLCASTLVAGVGLVPATTSAVAPRVLPLLGLLARTLLQHLAGIERPPLQSLFAALLGGSAPPPLLLSLLCQACLAVLQTHAGQEGHVCVTTIGAQALAAGLLQWTCPQVFLEAARTGQGTAAAAAGADAAGWLLVCVARSAGGTEAPRILAEALGPLDLSGPGAISAASLAAALCDLGGQGLLAASERERLAEGLTRTYATAAQPDAARQANLIAQALRSPPRQQPGQAYLATHLGSVATGLQSVLWLHCLAQGEALKAENSAGAVSVSGPPLMVYVHVRPIWSRPGICHVVVRIDIYNVTGLSYRNVVVGVGVSWGGTTSGHVGAEGRVSPSSGASSWAFVEGLGRPCDHVIDALSCRTSATVWRDLFVRALSPLSLAISISYDNVAPDAAASPAVSAGGRSSTVPDDEVWSDDEEVESLRFLCHPCALPLSVYFRPFLGFDTPSGSTFPPPMVFLACPHSRTEPIADFGLDAATWEPPGFHRLSEAHCRHAAPGVLACLAAVALDEEAVLCLLCHGSSGRGRCQNLEARSNSEALLGDFLHDLPFWLATSRA